MTSSEYESKKASFSESSLKDAMLGLDIVS